MLNRWIVTAFLFLTSINSKARTFHWSILQQASHVISSRLGSEQELLCDYILTSEEEEQVTKFFVVTWTREVDFGNNRKKWRGLVVRSVDSFVASEDLVMDDNVHLSTSNNSLFISNLTKSNSGKYQCELRTSFYTSPSLVQLDVQYSPEGTKLVLEKLIRNQTVALKCSVSSSNPQPNYRFYYNHELLGTRKSGLYKLGLLTSPKAGTYTCIPYNSVGEGPRAVVTYSASDESPGENTTTDQKTPVFIAGSVIGLALLFLLSLLSLICCRRTKKGGQVVKVNRQ